MAYAADSQHNIIGYRNIPLHARFLYAMTTYLYAVTQPFLNHTMHVVVNNNIPAHMVLSVYNLSSNACDGSCNAD